jgi:hypothetical protein
MRYPSTCRWRITNLGCAGLLGASLLAGCSADRQGAGAVAPGEVFPTYEQAVLRDLKPDASHDATLAARASDERRQDVPVPDHGCDFIIQPVGPVVLKDGTAENLDAAGGDALWTVILHSVHGDWRIIGAGRGWMPRPATSVTRGWPDLTTGSVVREGIASVSLLQYDGRHYRPAASATISSDLCAWAPRCGAIPADLAATILADTVGRPSAQVQNAPGLAFFKLDDSGAPALALVSMGSVVADGWSFDLTGLGDRSANVFLYGRDAGRWVRLASVRTRQLVCCPAYDADTQTWTLTAQTGGSLADPILKELRFHQGAASDAGAATGAAMR